MSEHIPEKVRLAGLQHEALDKAYQLLAVLGALDSPDSIEVRSSQEVCSLIRVAINLADFLRESSDKALDMLELGHPHNSSPQPKEQYQ